MIIMLKEQFHYQQFLRYDFSISGIIKFDGKNVADNFDPLP